MFCKNCGQKIEGTVKFCPECGTAQTVSEKSRFKISNKNSVADFNASFLQKLAYLLPFFISLQNGVFSNSRI